MTQDNHPIRDILMLLYENYKNTGNIWGLPLEEIKVDFPDTVSPKIMFFSIDTLLSAVKEALLTEFGSKDSLTINDLKESLGNEKFIGRYKEFLENYQNIIRRIYSVAEGLGYKPYFYAKSIGAEFLHWMYPSTEEIINNLRQSLKEAKEILVYSPIEFKVLREVLGEKVKFFFDLSLKTISLPQDATYQESCIITRYFSKPNYWSTIISTIPIKHPLSGNLTVCCGEFIWYLKPSMTIKNAVHRLKEFESFGAKKVFVSCPSSYAIYRAAKRNDETIRVTIHDISELIE